MWWRFRKLVWDNPFQRWFLVSLVVINLLGSVYGYYWYREQLLSTPPLLWIFVPDSPFSTTLLAVALVLVLTRLRRPFLELTANAMVIKYGLWAVAVISHYWWIGGEIKWVEIMLWFSHLGMAVEGLIFLRHLSVTGTMTGGLAFWLLLEDVVDYGGGLHPYLFDPRQWPVALGTALVLSVFLIFGTWQRLTRHQANYL